MLTLLEEFLLLSIHEDKGTVMGWTVDRMQHGLIGALLAELALMGKIQTSESHRLQVLDDKPTRDDLLDEALAALKESEKERKFAYWINVLGQRADRLRKQLIERLISKGIVTHEDDHLLWVTPTPLNPEINASAKYWLNARLRGIVLAQETAEPCDIALLSLLRACDFLDLTFLKDERRLASRQINELVVSTAMKTPGFQIIQEIESAIAVVAEDD